MALAPATIAQAALAMLGTAAASMAGMWAARALDTPLLLESAQPNAGLACSGLVWTLWPRLQAVTQAVMLFGISWVVLVMCQHPPSPVRQLLSGLVLILYGEVAADEPAPLLMDRLDEASLDGSRDNEAFDANVMDGARALRGQGHQPGGGMSGLAGRRNSLFMPAFEPLSNSMHAGGLAGLPDPSGRQFGRKVSFSRHLDRAAADSAAPKSSVRIIEHRDGPKVTTKRNRIQVLSVDDQPVNQQVIRSLLQGGDFEMIELDSGEELVAYMERCDELPDVVLLDLSLPGISGCEATQILRKRWTGAELPIIMITCLSQESAVVQGLESGANDFMTKPIRYAELRARINTQMALKRGLQLAIEANQNLALLRSILPSNIIAQLKQGAGLVAEMHQEVTILFSDIRGFTNLSATWPTERIIEMLNTMFCGFDRLCDELGVCKVETIGDAYMIASGHDNVPDHAMRMMRMACAMLDMVRSMKPSYEHPIEIRIGVHTGPAHSGVVGSTRPRYCFFGDTVNVASRMETNGFPMTVHVSDATCKAVLQQQAAMRALGQQWEDPWGAGPYDFAPCGMRSIKGKGKMLTHLLKHGPWQEGIASIAASASAPESQPKATLHRRRPSGGPPRPLQAPFHSQPASPREVEPFYGGSVGGRGARQGPVQGLLRGVLQRQGGGVGASDASLHAHQHHEDTGLVPDVPSVDGSGFPSTYENDMFDDIGSDLHSGAGPAHSQALSGGAGAGDLDEVFDDGFEVESERLFYRSSSTMSRQLSGSLQAAAAAAAVASVGGGGGSTGPRYDTRSQQSSPGVVSGFSVQARSSISGRSASPVKPLQPQLQQQQRQQQPQQQQQQRMHAAGLEAVSLSGSPKTQVQGGGSWPRPAVPAPARPPPSRETSFKSVQQLTRQAQKAKLGVMRRPMSSNGGTAPPAMLLRSSSVNATSGTSGAAVASVSKLGMAAGGSPPPHLGGSLNSAFTRGVAAPLGPLGSDTRQGKGPASGGQGPASNPSPHPLVSSSGGPRMSLGGFGSGPYSGPPTGVGGPGVNGVSDSPRLESELLALWDAMLDPAEPTSRGGGVRGTSSSTVPVPHMLA